MPTSSIDSTSSIFNGPVPLAPQHESTLRSPTSQPRDSKILIVDDESVNIKVTRKYLEQAGYNNFISTTDSTEALDLIAKELPDLVLLDIVMPKMTGLDILRAVRSNKSFDNIPVVILTASTDPETKSTALQLGATDFLSTLR